MARIIIVLDMENDSVENVTDEKVYTYLQELMDDCSLYYDVEE